jgi:hypothetical protein
VTPLEQVAATPSRATQLITQGRTSEGTLPWLVALS